MRADYFDRYASEYKYGLKILGEKSQFYTNCNLNHVPTETAPGHATILTGRPPGDNGMIGNDWFDRASGKVIDCVYDQNFEIGPANLFAPTLGDSMKDQDPSSIVVSVSYKDRAAICMGGQRANIVLWFGKNQKRFVTSGAYGAEPAWLPKFNQMNRMKTLIPAAPETDALLFELVKTVTQEIRLGEDEHTDLLAISFSATDLIGHIYGPDSSQMHKQLLALDVLLGKLIDFLKLKTNDDFVLALTSDHGVAPVPESDQGKAAGIKRLKIKDLERQLEDACQRLSPAPNEKWILGTFVPDVYLNKELLQKRKMDWGDFLLRVSTEWKKNPYVAQVYLNNPLIPQDSFSSMYFRSYCAGRSGDLFLRMTPDILLTNKSMGTAHGSPYENDTHVPLLFYGKDFPAEKVTTKTSNEILAPTLAKSIGIDF